ncbi:YciI family protein [Synechococcus sp. RSCCF101]|uniref:YciI family protein n=1 Tax=Synechococcus sp. RSCCF101 TaxID=2511069 RepID=UPI001CD940E4|nr:YciI family protein [Synechococcus sp. RSCCF101]
MTLYAVIVATRADYYDYKRAHPEHDQNQLTWFKQQEEAGTLLACGPFAPHDGTGLWILEASSLAEAQRIVGSSPRSQDGMLAESARIVEWEAHIGKHRFLH